MSKAPLLVTVPTMSDMVRARLQGRVEMAAVPRAADLIDWLRENGDAVRAAIVAGNERWDDEVFALMPNLKLLATFGGGAEGVDMAAAAKRGIAVSSASLHAAEVANFTLALMLAAWWRIPEADRWTREGHWTAKERFPSLRSITSIKVGVVGLGHIGKAFAERAEALGCAVAWWGRTPRPEMRWPFHASLVELAKASDVLAVTIRANEDTRKLINREVIDALGPEGLLINVARGFVVDEDALIVALRDGRLGQAALDVFDPEPTSAERWADVPNTLLAPHIGGATTDALDLLADDAVRRVMRVLAD